MNPMKKLIATLALTCLVIYLYQYSSEKEYIATKQETHDAWKTFEKSKSSDQITARVPTQKEAQQAPHSAA